ncbi:unnamed protein product [Candida verbasci]|uniref:DNA mismatch repair protein PMS1 n=1 Tax=Candida verbasci TaxID=1227364 RepID=A0A9W4XD85_9ASCO|nr:unnamed protein product [Candida verbasci]
MTSSIKNINQDDISKITSTQVIIDLRTIVKELIENSIDAGSDKIEITFVNYGIDSISIQDNGKGIEEEDFETLCLRSHTSKISQFEDLNSLNTLGFRGEALNSICSLSKTISIRTSIEKIYPRNFTLSYNNFGELTNRSQKVGGVSNKSGTLITIESLFHNLPVRLKNFIKNSKREFHKCINFIINYLLIYPNIKFTIYNILPANNKKQVVLSSKGGVKTSVVDNLISIFGNNQNKNLLNINLEITPEIKIDGYISSYSFGLGRSSGDRQFLFINKRPINYKNLSKLINEVYKQYNHVQFPIYVLNIDINPNLIDINLLPDKSNVLINDELKVLELVRQKLADFFEFQDKVMIPKNNMKEELTQIESEQPELSEVENKNYSKPQTKVTDFIFNQTNMNESISRQEVLNDENDVNEGQESHESDLGMGADDSNDDYQEEEGERSDNEATTNLSREFDVLEGSKSKDFDSGNVEVGESIQDSSKIRENDSAFKTKKEEHSESQEEAITLSSGYTSSSQAFLQDGTIFDENDEKIQDNHGVNFYPVSNQNTLSIEIGQKNYEEPQLKKRKIEKRSDLFKISKTHSREDVLSQFKNLKNLNLPKSTSESTEVNINEQLSDSEIYHITKNDFLKMKLIGQFNLGFILVKHDSNLFIIDQHASDEKYNFEKLNESFQVKYQPLIAKQNLDLNIIDEMLVLDNEKIFQNNGFKLTIDKDKSPGSRISLASLPVYKKSMFEIDDFYELINLINENPGNQNLKCSKIRKIIAMKACRSSIMIGSFLSNKKMKEIVKNLSTLDKPWNCPHGRPTMRHLTELKNWHDNYYDYEL